MRVEKETQGSVPTSPRAHMVPLEKKQREGWPVSRWALPRSGGFSESPASVVPQALEQDSGLPPSLREGRQLSKGGREGGEARLTGLLCGLPGDGPANPTGRGLFVL